MERLILKQELKKFYSGEEMSEELYDILCSFSKEQIKKTEFKGTPQHIVDEMLEYANHQVFNMVLRRKVKHPSEDTYRFLRLVAYSGLRYVHFKFKSGELGDDRMK